MGRPVGQKPERTKPADDVNVLVDPGLRMLIVEAVSIIEIDRNVGIGQMRAGGRREPIANQHERGGQRGPGNQRAFVVTEPAQQPEK